MADVRTLIKQEMAVARPRVTLQRLADALSEASGERVSTHVVYNMLNGRTNVPPLLVQEARRLLGKPETWPEADENAQTFEASELIPVRLLSLPKEALPSYRIEGKSMTILVPSKLAALNPVAHVVEDDSMMPALEPGTVAIFTRTTQPRAGYTFLVKNGAYAIRTVFWQNDKWIARPLNPAFEEQPLQAGSIEGLLVGWYRESGTRETTDLDRNGLRLV